MTWILGPHWAAEVGRMPSVNGPEKECVATQILRQLPLADKTSVWGTLGTIRPHLSFDVEKDVQTLLGTVSGRGVDYRTIIDLLTNRSNEQCQQIAKEFLDFTKQDLLTTLQAAVPANLEGFVAGLLRPAAQYDAHEIKAALKVQRLARRSRPPLATSHHPALRLDWGAGVWSARARHFPGCPTVVARQPHAPSSSPSSRGHQKRVWSWTRLGSRPCCASNRRFALPRPPITPLLDFVILFLTCQITHILWGPEVETLTEILCTRTNQQLREILRFYKNDFKSDFEKDVASGTSGWLKDLLVALSQGKRERYSGVIDYILIDQDTKVRYGLCGEVGRASVFARPVEGRPSPAEKRFPCSVKYRRCDKLRAKKLWGSSEERRRTQNSLRTKRALVDADGGGHAGKLQESEWVRILTQRSPEHLNRVFSCYQKRRGLPVEEAVQRIFRGQAQAAGLTLVSLLRNTPLYLARKLYQAVKGPRGNARTLARIMISRRETDLLSVRVEFRKHYGVSLYSFLMEGHAHIFAPSFCLRLYPPP
ncbi:annexin A9 isoform X4 [Varanus komodoensis]|uniref:annexin A9 isoform X4 n=1 Tax=Varanus komodoensis TaxID=61221 RepID=UPI001CF7CE73|nr:annexin A9 isoform X4 [Varanus komodoensis]